MANDLTILGGAGLPSYLDDQEIGANITERETVPSLSYEGKTWTVVLKGEKKPLQRRNEDGDLEPIPIMRVVLLDFAPNRGRTFYEGGYDRDKPGKPVCWSEDSKVADPAITEAPFEGWTGKCDGCPKSIKGSKVTDAGKAVTACSLHRMVAVLPVSKAGLFHTPLRMKLAITSLYDKDNPLEAEGWYAFDNYLRHLQKAMPNQHTCKLVTKMKFDPDAQYPKVLFCEDRWVTADEFAALKPIVKSDEVRALISGQWSPDGVGGTRRDEVDPETVTQAKALREAEEAKVAAEAKAAAEAEAKAKAKAKAAAEAKAVAAAKAKAAAAAAEDDDGGLSALDGEVIPPPAKPKAGGASVVKNVAPPKDVEAPAKADAKATKAPPPELGSLLTDWDN